MEHREDGGYIDRALKGLPRAPHAPHSVVVAGQSQWNEDHKRHPTGPDAGLCKIAGDLGQRAQFQEIGNRVKGGIAERGHAEITPPRQQPPGPLAGGEHHDEWAHHQRNDHEPGGKLPGNMHEFTIGHGALCQSEGERHGRNGQKQPEKCGAVEGGFECGHCSYSGSVEWVRT